jgi:hypothetical protein
MLAAKCLMHHYEQVVDTHPCALSHILGAHDVDLRRDIQT